MSFASKNQSVRPSQHKLATTAVRRLQLVSQQTRPQPKRRRVLSFDTKSLRPKHRVFTKVVLNIDDRKVANYSIVRHPVDATCKKARALHSVLRGASDTVLLDGTWGTYRARLNLIVKDDSGLAVDCMILWLINHISR